MKRLLFSVLLLFKIKKFDSHHLTAVSITKTCSVVKCSKFGLEFKSDILSAYNTDLQSILQTKSFIAIINKNGPSTSC